MFRTVPVVAFLIVSLGVLTGKSADGPYRQTREIHTDLEDASPTAIDSSSGRLFIASKRGIFTYDMTRNRLVGRFSDVAGGPLAIAPDLGRLLIASNGAVTLIDVADGHTIESAPLAGWAMSVLYDADAHEFLVDRRGDDRRDFVVYDRGGRQVRRLSGFTDMGEAALAAPGRLLLVGADHISVVRTDTGATSAWPLEGRERIRYVTFDPIGKRAFVGLEGTVVMLDGMTGARLASLHTGSLMALGFDRIAQQLVYCWNARGDEAYVTVVQVEGDRMATVQQIRIPTGAHDLQFDIAKGGFTFGTDPGGTVSAFRRLSFALK